MLGITAQGPRHCCNWKQHPFIIWQVCKCTSPQCVLCMWMWLSGSNNWFSWCMYPQLCRYHGGLTAATPPTILLLAVTMASISVIIVALPSTLNITGYYRHSLHQRPPVYNLSDDFLHICVFASSLYFLCVMIFWQKQQQVAATFKDPALPLPSKLQHCAHAYIILLLLCATIMDMSSINHMAIARQFNEAISNLHQMSTANIAMFISCFNV